MLAESVATKTSCLEVWACCGCFEKEILQIRPWADAQRLRVSVHGSFVNTFTKTEETYLEESHFNSHDGVFRKKKKGTSRKGGRLKNSLLQDILWSFSGWLTENLISSWACNCRSFCSMSAIADLINKVLWQRTVYFQGLDLRAERSGVGYSLPHIHSRRHANTTYCTARARTDVHTHAHATRGHPVKLQRLVSFYSFLDVTKFCDNVRKLSILKVDFAVNKSGSDYLRMTK